MFIIILISFFSGILTVLAPCVLPLLPVILGGSLAGKNKARPYIIIASLIVSLLLFTLLLKASTVLIHVDPVVWEYVSGGLLVLFSVTLIFPSLWVWLMDVTGTEKLSQNSLEQASYREGIWGPIALGAALGPVFSSCNPTYTVLLATILPASITMGLIGLGAYFLGLGIILLLVVHFGRGIIGRFAFFANPRGMFRRALGLIILIIGVLILTGDIKRLETYVIDKNIFINTASLDEKLNNIILKNHNDTGSMCKSGKCDDKRKNTLMMDLGKAPEFSGIAAWINSNPLTMESLRGKVVLIDFWTYSCINCIRTQPYLNAWYDKYEKDGLVIIGVHAPEFAFEKVERNVRESVKKDGIRYPVALDNDFKTWNAYGNHYWPAKYLIDQKGNIVYKHFGEGAYVETEKVIQSLLGLEKNLVDIQKGTSGNTEKTPETYLGSARAERMALSGKYAPGEYDFIPGNIDTSSGLWTLSGKWKVTPEYIESLSDDAFILFHFAAKDAFVVISGSNENKSVKVVSRTPVSTDRLVETIPVKTDSLYSVFHRDSFSPDANVLIGVNKGLRLHAFTFGN